MKSLIVRPRDMHIVKSFIGCVGPLMSWMGLEELLAVLFKGITNMLDGKAWPKALRGLRMVVVARPEPIISITR